MAMLAAVAGEANTGKLGLRVSLLKGRDKELYKLRPQPSAFTDPSITPTSIDPESKEGAPPKLDISNFKLLGSKGSCSLQARHLEEEADVPGICPARRQQARSELFGLFHV